MHQEILCLIQLLQLYIPQYYPCDDIVVYHLYNARKVLSSSKLREYLEEFIMLGFNPYSRSLSQTSKVMMKSVVAKCDSII